jgi:hypothetical protein
VTDDCCETLAGVGVDIHTYASVKEKSSHSSSSWYVTYSYKRDENLDEFLQMIYTFHGAFLLVCYYHHHWMNNKS